MGLSCKPQGKMRSLLAKLKNEEEKKRKAVVENTKSNNKKQVKNG